MIMTGLTNAQINTQVALNAQQAIINENMAALEATRYHVDIAFEAGGTVLPDIATARAANRAAIVAALAEIAKINNAV